MNACDAAMRVIGEIVENNDKLPTEWMNAVESYQPSDFSLHVEDVAIISQVIKLISPCKLLEIGSGRSTAFLFDRNRNGLNVSLEDNHDWLVNVADELRSGLGLLINYSHQTIETAPDEPVSMKKRIRSLLQSDSTSQLDEQYLQKRAIIPDWLWTIEFDLIIVDGPYGAAPTAPGRSGTILLSSKLASSKSVIFIDDAPNKQRLENRWIEAFLSSRFEWTTPSDNLCILI
jgi:hypothetical protein